MAVAAEWWRRQPVLQQRLTAPHLLPQLSAAFCEPQRRPRLAMVSEKRDSLSRDSNALGGVQQPVFPTGLLFPKSPYVIPSLFLHHQPRGKFRKPAGGSPGPI